MWKVQCALRRSAHSSGLLPGPQLGLLQSSLRLEICSELSNVTATAICSSCSILALLFDMILLLKESFFEGY